MDCPCIPHTQIPGSTALFTDCLYDFARVSEFYAHPPLQDESFSKAAQEIPYDAGFRSQVIAALREQNRNLGAGEKVFENLSRLQERNCVAVVTGHQAGLFSGPAFGLYKGLSAVKLARALTDRGIPAVPVFWLATEDHDLEEVNHCFVRDREGSPLRVEYRGEAPVANAPVGSVSFTDEILSSLNELRAALPESPASAELLGDLSEFYQPGKTFGQAFGGLLSCWFAEFGVIMVNPMDRRLHSLTASVFQNAIRSAAAITGDLLQRNRSLADRGYHTQVRVTEDFTLLFVHVEGQRRALRMRGGQFATAQGDRYSAEDLLKQLEGQPETISANVLLRPVMQDALLPTIAYVGGPSELAYFAQAGAVYRRILGRMPVAFPRASITVLDAPSNRLMGKYELTLPDIFAGKQALRDKMAARFLPADLTATFQKTAASLESNLQAIQAALARLDPTLVDAAANSGRKMQYQLSTLEHKAAAAIQKRSEQIEHDAVRLENSIYPAKSQQERLYSGAFFLARYGAAFLKQLYEEIPLHSAQHQMIVL